jgi:hypothetical protein
MNNRSHKLGDGEEDGFTAPPLLLAVLVQVVTQACHRRLRSSLYSHTHEHRDPTVTKREVENQILLELLASASDASIASPPLPYGRGYPRNTMVSLCVALYTCARQPDVVLSLPHIDMPGITETNPFADVEGGEGERSRKLRKEICRVVGEIDDNIDLMNAPEVS